MKKSTQRIPDKVIELSRGDKVKIYGSKTKISFDFFCDCDGNTFSLTKQEIMEILK
jgi:hypothetical protein